MKIAQVAPPWLPIPPPGYGGIELVVALLCDGLSALGHDVDLYAAPGSGTAARLVRTLDEAPGTGALDTPLQPFYETVHAYGAYRRAGAYDVVHDHSGAVGVALAGLCGAPAVHTVHGPLDERARRVYGLVADRVGLVAISRAQRASAPEISFAGMVHNGLPLEKYPFRADKEDFLLFLGRSHPNKGADVAVDVARRLGVRLVMAVKKVEAGEHAYWRERVEPLLTGREEILSELTPDEKGDLLSRARALLFPIRWPEPFGLVMAEANACGTPVIGFPLGAAPEVVDHGRTGFLVSDADEMCSAVERTGEIDPAACRRHVEERFGAATMVQGYVEVYARILGER